MKKITFYFLMLLSVTAFSQVEILEDFEGTSNGSVPSGWTADGLPATNGGGCNGSVGAAGFVAASDTGSITSPNYSAITNTTDLTVSFDYNVYERVNFWTYNAPPAGWGSIEFQYSTDGGTNWVTPTGATADDSVFTYVDRQTCANLGFTVSGLTDGLDFQFRFVATNDSAVQLLFSVDNVSVLQEATQAPVCNAVLTTPNGENEETYPEGGSTLVSVAPTLNWSNATGLASGYQINVGITEGGTEVVDGVEVTETNYGLTGLDYDTEYFVTIIPFNDFDNNTTNDYATGCTEVSFTTRSAPVTGATCADPLVVNLSGVYVNTNDTANFEDIVDSNPCSSSYMRGNDAFYQIPAATEDRSIDVQVIYNWNTSNGNFYSSSILIFDGCPSDGATNCVVYDGTFTVPQNEAGLYERSLENVVLSANQDYYVVLSSGASNPETQAYFTYPYTMVISQDACINPEMTVTAVEDCANGGFSIDANISYVGDASTLTLSDGLGGTITGITEAGTVNMPGPYTSGQTITLKLTNDDQTSCFVEAETSYYCPPSNDECSGAEALTVNTDNTCTISVDGTNGGATFTEIVGAGTGSTCSAGNNDVWYSFVAPTSGNVVIQYTNVAPAIGSSTALMSTEVFSTTDGTCSGDFTSLICRRGDFIYLSELTSGDTYYIRNTSASATNEQTFTICLKEPVAPANDECANAITLTASTTDACENAVSGTTVGASTSSESACPNTETASYGDVWYTFTPDTDSLYEFSLTIDTENDPNPTTYFYVYSGTCGALVEQSTNCSSNENQVLSLSSSETYFVIVRSIQNTEGENFVLCVFELPEPVENDNCETPFVLTESADETGNNAIVGNLDNSYPSIQACQNTSFNAIWYSFTPTYTGEYVFNLTRTSGTAYYAVYDTDDCSATGGSSNPDYIEGFGSCYNGSTDVVGTVVGGNTYLVSVHANGDAEFELFAYPTGETLSVNNVNNVFKGFTYYPNPVLNTLTIEAGNDISNVSVRNMLGQQVMAVNPNSLKASVNMNELNEGVYFVTVQVNGAQKTFKVVKK
ncbi:MAG: T9SS type A sorting domain-containing protein [Xanthomarina gelatinilytica]|uniref:T9SS type A sorting domain-containing protein n=1 Tax=Xanthomarina gelatinilytica TaxID=1137281 RepID=UPI003A84A2BE